MHDWYRAFCPSCNECHHIFITSNYHTKLAFGDAWISKWKMLKDDGWDILHSWLSTAFLNKHYGCELDLLWRDDQNEKLWDLNTKQIEFNHLSFEEFREYVIKNMTMMSDSIFDSFVNEHMEKIEDAT